MSGPAPTVRRLQLAPDLWVAEHPLRSLGLEVGRRMTVVRLAGGGLWLHSVCRLAPEVRSWLDALGPVRFVVSPSPMHHFFMEQYAAAYPAAMLLGPPELAARRPDLPLGGVLGEEPRPEWAADLEQVVFRGLRLVPVEIEFLHPATRTLILTDLCFRFTREHPPLTRLVGRLLGVYERLGVPREMRWWPRDREAARAAAARMLAWDFDRVIVAHGSILETGGRAAMERAFAWAR